MKSIALKWGASLGRMAKAAPRDLVYLLIGATGLCAGALVTATVLKLIMLLRPA